jgi:putative NADH-flavin reductase
MKLFVLGATGRTGAHILDLALSRGHEVTAFVRSPLKLAARPGLRVVVGDPRTGVGLAAAMAGQQAVLSVLGAYAGEALRRSTLMTELGTSVARAMAEAKVSRLVVLSAAVLFPGEGLFYAFFRWLLKHHARDLTAMESAVRASDLAWTITRPPRLVQSSDLACRHAVGAVPPNGTKIAYRAVAQFMLTSIEQETFVREIVGIAR